MYAHNTYIRTDKTIMNQQDKRKKGDGRERARARERERASEREPDAHVYARNDVTGYRAPFNQLLLVDEPDGLVLLFPSREICVNARLGIVEPSHYLLYQPVCQRCEVCQRCIFG